MVLLHPELLGTFAIAGALFFLAIRQVIVWRVSPGRSYVPWAGITIVGLGFACARIVHLSTLDPELALFTVRLKYAASLLLPGFALATIDRLHVHHFTKETKVALVAGLVCLPLGVVTPWLVHGPGTVQFDAFGHPYIGGRAGWFALVLAPLAAWMLWTLREKIRRSENVPRRERITLRVGVVLFMVVGMHDVLVGLGTIHSVFLLEYVYVIFGWMAASLETRLYAGYQTKLDSELQRSRERYQQLADATQEGVFVCVAGRVIDANRAAQLMLGLTEAEVIDVELRDAVDSESRPRVDALLAGSREPIEVTIPRPGAALRGEMRAVAPPAGSEAAEIVVLRDVTAERAMQSRLAVADRLAAVGTLAAGTAHEINNPLAFVLTNAELMRDELAASGTMPTREVLQRWAEHTNDIVTGASRIKRVVGDLSTLSREKDDATGEADLGVTLDNCVVMANPQLRHRARIVRQYESRRRVVANESRLFQVCLNLIVNAAQAIPEGSYDTNSITLATRDEGDEVVLSITDTGCGMDAATLARIFTPFFTTKDVGRGTGLGLSISHTLVEGMGGRIDVTSAPGQGTTIRVTLRAVEISQVIERVPPPTVRGVEGVRLSVLVIDDEEMVAKGFARALQSHAVHVVHSGRDALARLKEHTFDLAVCDLMMPDITGMELHRLLRAEGNPVADRFVFMTGGALSDVSAEFLATVAKDRWLAKPVSIADLRRIAKNVTLGRPPLAE